MALEQAELRELEKGTNPLSFTLFLLTVLSTLTLIAGAGGMLVQPLQALLPSVAATGCLAGATWSAHQIQGPYSAGVKTGCLLLTLCLMALAGMCWYLAIYSVESA